MELLSPEDLRRTVTTFRDTLKRHQAGINRLNVYPVPDGDTGTNMARTLDAVVEEMEKSAPILEDTCKAISHGSLMGARGNSGVRRFSVASQALSRPPKMLVEQKLQKHLRLLQLLHMKQC